MQMMFFVLIILSIAVNIEAQWRKVTKAPKIKITQTDINALFKRYFEETSNDVAKCSGGRCKPPIRYCGIANRSLVSNHPGIKYIGVSFWRHSLSCGTCFNITVTGQRSGVQPANGSYIGIVTEHCSHCKTGSIDFGSDGNGGKGGFKIHHHAISCPDPTNGNIKFRVLKYRFQGFKVRYMKIVVTSGRLPTAGLEILDNRNWYCMNRTEDNSFIIDHIDFKAQIIFEFPIRIRFTSIAGERLESTIKGLTAATIDSGVQYKAIENIFPYRPPSPPAIACHGQGGLVTPYIGTGAPPTREICRDKASNCKSFIDSCCTPTVMKNCRETCNLCTKKSRTKCGASGVAISIATLYFIVIWTVGKLVF